MSITRQIARAQERKKKKEDRKLIRKLHLCDFTYEADDKNMTLSALGPQLVDFTSVLGLSGFFREHVHLDKRKSPYSLQSGQVVFFHDLTEHYGLWAD